MFRSSSSSGSWFSSWALRASCASDTHRSAAYRLLLLCRWDLRHRDNVSTHLSLQLLLVHVSVFAHQHSVCRRRSANLRSPLAQTHPNTHTHAYRHRHRHRHTHTHTHRERHTHTQTERETRTHTHTRTHTERETHTHTHTDRETRTHTHTHTRSVTHEARVGGAACVIDSYLVSSSL